MLKGHDLEELIFETLEVGSKKLKSSFFGLATRENPFPFFIVFHLEEEEQDVNSRNSI